MQRARFDVFFFPAVFASSMKGVDLTSQEPESKPFQGF